MARVLRLPDRGRLLVCTDLQGCMRDFQRIAALFRRALIDTGDAHLLFTGDLVHGPHIARDDWPDFLGEYYRDQSGEVMDAFADLQAEFPGRVHAIMGNHEHGHVGGPHTAKFAPDEVALLEHVLGPEATARIQEVMADLPLIAIAPCGVVFTHGAPNLAVDSLAEIEEASLDLSAIESPADIFQVPVVGPLLWSRSAPPAVARAFLRAVGGTVSIYGHDVIPQGYLMIGDEQMVVSTSFGVYDRHKVYVELDLAARYETVHDIRPGREIRPLYPKVAATTGPPPPPRMRRQ
jgi:hypothetical protein